MLHLALARSAATSYLQVAYAGEEADVTSRQEAMQVDEGKVMRVMLMHALAKRAAAMVARAGGSKRQRVVTGGKRKRGAGGGERPSEGDSI